MPAQTMLNAISVPIDMASVRASRVVKKAVPAVDTPVIMVPMTGTSKRLTVQ